MHWLSHFLGLDNLSGPFYGWWSGAGSDLGEVAIVGALLATVRRHNCQVRRCWRIGRHITNGGHVVCAKHHPDGAPTAEDVAVAHQKAA